MADEHWFDALNREMVSRLSRRGILSTAGAVIAGFVQGDATEIEAGKRKDKKKKDKKKKGNGKGNNNGNGNGNGGGNGECSGGACDAAWADEHNRNYCEFICRQCDGSDPRNFCIVKDHIVGTPFAVCCEEGAECCGDRCCGAPREPGRHRCCEGDCRDTNNDPAHCGRCSNPCGGGEICELGFCVCGPGASGSARAGDCNQTCGDTNNDPFNCGSCGNICASGQSCDRGTCKCPRNMEVCNGACIDLSNDNRHCGSCNKSCISGESCQDGVCGRRCPGDHPQPCTINTINGHYVTCILADDVCCDGYFCSNGQACCEWFCGPNNSCDREDY